MTVCRGCEATVNTWFGDAWCEDCGGVMSRPGVLLMRHVATAFFGTKEVSDVRIVHDISSEKYKFRCNRTNPRYEAFLRGGGLMRQDEDFVPTPVLTKWDKTLSGLFPKLREEFDSSRNPQFHITDRATEQERKTLEA